VCSFVGGTEFSITGRTICKSLSDINRPVTTLVRKGVPDAAAAGDREESQLSVLEPTA
jgi:hypothetical protein